MDLVNCLVTTEMRKLRAAHESAYFFPVDINSKQRLKTETCCKIHCFFKRLVISNNSLQAGRSDSRATQSPGQVLAVLSHTDPL